MAIDVGLMGIGVTGRAGRSTFEKTATLPEADGVVRKPARPSVRPVRGIRRTAFLAEFENGHEVIEVVVARDKSRHGEIAQRMTLRADHRRSVGSELSGHDDR